MVWSLFIYLLFILAIFPILKRLKLINGRFRKRLEADIRDIRPLFFVSLYLFLPLAIAAVLINWGYNHRQMPLMTPADIPRLEVLLPEFQYRFSHWLDIMFLWVWSFATLVFYKWRQRLGLVLVVILGAIVFGIFVAFQFKGVLYGLVGDVLFLVAYRLFGFLIRIFGIEELESGDQKKGIRKSG